MGWDDAPPKPGELQRSASWDTEPPKPEELKQNAEPYSVGGLLSNTAHNIARLPAGYAQTLKMGFYDAPKEAGKALFQFPQYVAKKMMGDPNAQAPTFPMANEVRGQAQQIAKNPARWAYENPVDAALTVATPFMAAKMFRSPTPGPLPENYAPNFLQRTGAYETNEAAGIKPGTIEDMTPWKQNPADFGYKVGSELLDKDLVKQTPRGTYDAVQGQLDQYGKQVGGALKEARDANHALGQYPEMEDSLKRNATPVLKPLLDKATSLEGSRYPQDKFEAGTWRAAYESLADKTNTNDGYITLDHVTNELHKLGEMMGSAGPDHVKIIGKVYRTLADMRDGMIEDVASSTGNEGLSQRLRDANAGYSRFVRVAPDVRTAASQEGAGRRGFSFKHPVNSTIDMARPWLARKAYDAGGFSKNAANYYRRVRTGVPATPIAAQGDTYKERGGR